MSRYFMQNGDCFEEVSNDGKIVTLKDKQGKEKKVRVSILTKSYTQAAAKDIKKFNEEVKEVTSEKENSSEVVQDVNTTEKVPVTNVTGEAIAPTIKPTSTQSETKKEENAVKTIAPKSGSRKVLFNTANLRDVFFTPDQLGVDLPIGLNTNSDIDVWVQTQLAKLNLGDIDFGLPNIVPADFKRALANSQMSYTENRTLLVRSVLTADAIEHPSEITEQAVEKYLKTVRYALMNYYKWSKTKEHVAANTPKK